MEHNPRVLANGWSISPGPGPARLTLDVDLGAGDRATILAAAAAVLERTRKQIEQMTERNAQA